MLQFVLYREQSIRPERPGLVRMSLLRTSRNPTAMAKYHHDTPPPSDPIQVSLSRKSLAFFKTQVPILRRIITNWKPVDERIEEHLLVGDSRAAFAFQHRGRMLVAAYTDEIDCVALLRFAPEFLQSRNIKNGTKLVTINTYFPGHDVVPDLVEGPNSYQRFENVFPVIADFVSQDVEVIQRRRESIESSEWERAVMLTKNLLARDYIYIRDGSPYGSFHVGSKYPNGT
jgi:hypothetical protein